MTRQLENEILSIGTTTDNIKNIAFSEVWTGEACTAQTELLKGIVSEAKTLESELNTFKSKVAELQQYKDLLNQIENKENTLNSMKQYIIIYSDNIYREEENPDYINLLNEINELKELASEKKNELMSYFNNSVSTDNNDIEMLDYIDELPDNLNYSDVDEIINKFFASQAGLSIISGSKAVTRSGGLYDVYASAGGRDYVFNRLKTAMDKAGSNNRQRSVNAVVELFNLTTSAGIQLPYVNKGAGSDGSFVTTDCVATGVDCNAFVCWAVDKGVPNGLQWRPCAGVNGLTNVGTNIDYNEWYRGKPGDVLSKGGRGQHSAYVLKNNPERASFIIAESTKRYGGIVLTEMSYQSLINKGMVLRDMEQVYSGENQESRYNAYQDRGNSRYSEVNIDLR